MKQLVCLVGPTAVGKSHVALQLAQRFNSDIVSADSRQVYKEMSIGTAKPTPEELKQVKHHFVGHISIHTRYSAGLFAEEARFFLESYFGSREVVIICGGTGLYFSALLEGMDRDAVSDHIRERVNQMIENEGIEALIDTLRKQDPTLASQVELTNPRRVTRALEWVLAGKPEKPKPTLPPDWKVIKIGLELPREVLFERINLRVDQMLEKGLWAEAVSLFPLRSLNALQTVGYQEIFKSLQGIISEKRAIELIKQHTRNYAKRQMTWFKRDPGIKWFSPDDQAGIEAVLDFSQGI